MTPSTWINNLVGNIQIRMDPQAIKKEALVKLKFQQMLMEALPKRKINSSIEKYEDLNPSHLALLIKKKKGRILKKISMKSLNILKKLK